MWLALYLYVLGVFAIAALAWIVSEKRDDDAVPALLVGIFWPISYPFGLLCAALKRGKT